MEGGLCLMKKFLCLILIVCIFTTLCPVIYASASNYSNLSLDAKVTVNRFLSNTYKGDYVKDGDYSTFWYFNNKDDDLTAEITLELSGIAYIDNIVIIENWMSTDSYFSDIQTSIDGKNWISPEKTLSKTSGTEYGTSSKAGRKRVYTFSDSVVAKYVRLKSPHDNHLQIREFEIYGKILNPYLSSLSLSDGELTPAFNKETTSYDVYVDSKDNLPAVYGVAADEGSTVVVTQADAQTMKAIVSVKTPTALGKEDFVFNYIVNMISLSSDSSLKSISLSEGELLEDFSEEVFEYHSYIEDGEIIPTISATPKSGTANVEITQAEENNLTATILVTSGDQEASKTYTVEFIPTGCTLSGLSVNGYELIPEFNEDVALYTVELENLSEVTEFPEVLWVKKYESSEIEFTEATSSSKKTQVKVTSALGSEKTYTINFEELIPYENIALGAVVKANGEVSGYPVQNAVDGDLETRWYVHKDSVDKGQIIVELSDIALIDTIKVLENNTSATDDMYSNIECSKDGISWFSPEKNYTHYSGLQFGNLSGLGRKRVYKMTDTVAAKYIRFTGVSGRNMILSEIEVYGKFINPYLSGITLSAGELNPRFDKAMLFYDVYVESENDLPTITAIAENPDADVVITQANTSTMQAFIDVIVENGKYTHRYVINMVPKLKDTNLKTLELSEGTLIPQFSREQLEYTVYIGSDDAIPTVSGVALSDVSEIEYTQATEDNLTATIKVISNDNSSFKEYKVNFIVTGTELKSIQAGGKELTPAFIPGHTEYSVVIGYNEALPTITAEAMYNTKSVNIAQATESSMLSKITVTSFLDETNVYQVRFYRMSNNEESARLSYIGLSKGNIEGVFDPENTKQTVYIQSRTNIPTVIAFTEHSEATAIVTQADAKTMMATINVTSADGVSTKEYEVYFLINTSLGRMCNASSSYSSTGAGNAFDGNLSTQWRASTGSAPQWVFCDIGADTMVYEVVVNTRYSSDPEAFSVIQKSNDGKNWTTLEIQSSNSEKIETTGDISSYNKITYKFEPFTTHYLKVTSPTPRQLGIVEFEVYGILAPTVSSNSYLKEIEFSNGVLTPVFSPYVSNYTLTIGKTEILPIITGAYPVNDFSTVEIEQATEETMQAKVTVTAENGIKKTVYTINIDKEVSAEKNTYLKAINLSLGELYPEFSPKNTNYKVFLAPESEIPTVLATAAASGAKATVLSDENGVQIKVTSKDGTQARVYNVTFEYVNVQLSELSVEGVAITPSFLPGVYEYFAEIASEEEIPVVSATAVGDAEIKITQADKKTMKAIVEVKLKGTDYKKTYTVNFKLKQSLEETIASVLDALKKFKASNDTTKEEIVSLIEKSITNKDVVISLESYNKEKATTKKAGLIRGVLGLTLGDISTNVEISKTLSKLSDSGSSGGGGGGGSSSGGGTSAVSLGNASSLPINNVGDKTQEENKDMFSEIRGHWAEKEVIALKNKGIVEGNGESFALDDEVTRAEFITMLIRAYNIGTLPYNNAFDDVKDTDWFAPFIQTATEKGIIEGAYGQVNPKKTTSREEAVKMLVSAYEIMTGKIEDAKEINFTDNEKISGWAKEYIEKAVSKGFVKGYETGEFGAKDTLNRAQAMAMIYRLISD